MNVLHEIEEFISGWRFAVTVISILFFTSLVMIAILLVPPSLGTMSAFAEDFKTWCFGYDAASGQLEWAYVFTFTVQPFVLLFFVALIWSKPLKAIIRENRAATFPYIFRSFVLVLFLSIGLPMIDSTDAISSSVAAFPAEGLRTSRNAHPFTLVDQNDEPFSLSDLDGRVVLLTAIYTTCGDTCPLILQQTRRVLDRLPDSENNPVSIVAITLDPETDTPEMMKGLFAAHGLEGYDIYGTTGGKSSVEKILQSYGFQKDLDPKTGMIMHSNKLIAIDTNGRIAYTFSIGSLQEEWLVEALTLLLSESA